MRHFPPYIAVFGPEAASPQEEARAYRVGRLLAEGGAVVLCGGCGGVMEAAAQGAKDGGGTTVALLPGTSRRQANPYIDVALPTGLGEGRNFLLVRACDAAVAVGGSFGTLSEIALMLKLEKPLVGLDTLEIRREGRELAGIHRAPSPEEAAAAALEYAGRRG